MLNVRKDFPILNEKINGHPLVYFDNGATTQKPKVVIEAINEYYSKFNANIHRGIHTLSEMSTDMFEKTRVETAKFLNTKSENIVFTKGTTESLNLIAFGLMHLLKKGDEIILSEMEHHANIVPWQVVAKRTGAKLKFIPITKDYQLDLEKYEKLLNKKTKIVSITQVSNVFGTINHVKKIIKLAKKHNAITSIDGAQAIPSMKIDVKKLDCDFYSFSGHKMFGPGGVGVLYGKKGMLEKLTPINYGGSMIEDVSLNKSTYAKVPFKLEAGTPNIVEVVVFSKTLEYIDKIGYDKIEKYKDELSKYFLEKIQEVEEVILYGPTNNRVPVFSIGFQNIHPHDISTLLNKVGIATRSGHHCCIPLMKKLKISGTCRISLTIYNTKEEIDKLIESLKKIKKMLA